MSPCAVAVTDTDAAPTKRCRESVERSRPTCGGPSVGAAANTAAVRIAPHEVEGANMAPHDAFGRPLGGPHGNDRACHACP